MNTDTALTLMAAAGASFGFLIGYAKGHEHGKIKGRIEIRRARRLKERV